MNSYIDNVINSQKAQINTSHHLKKLLKPIFALLKKKSAIGCDKKNSFVACEEIDDNIANELLSAKLLQEIENCPPEATISVYLGDDSAVNVVPVPQYIPVHFAKTEAGTFFWTCSSPTSRPADCDVDPEGDRNAIKRHQLPSLQVSPGDRWVQA